MIKKSAFTIIELLIVIGVIGVLSGILYTVISVPELRTRAQDVTRREDLSSIEGIIQRYYLIKGSYPKTGTMSDYTSFSNSYLSYLGISAGFYTGAIPRDTAKNRYYLYSSDGSNYCICTEFQASNAQPSSSGCPIPVTYNVSKIYCKTNSVVP